MAAVMDSRLSNLDPMIALVRQRVSGPLDSQITKALVSAAIDFCKRSALVHMERTFDVVYEGQTVSFAKASSINRQARQQVTEPQVTGSVIHRITAGSNDLQRGVDYHVQSAESIRFLSEFNDVRIIGAIEPLPTATLIPTAIIEDYAEALADGATAILQLQPGKPWTNPDSAGARKMAFNDAVRDAYRFRVEHTPNAEPYNPVRRRSFC